jgi:hypothetical protein
MKKGKKERKRKQKSPLTCFYMVPFPNPSRRMRGFFSNICFENLVELLEIKLTKVYSTYD